MPPPSSLFSSRISHGPGGPPFASPAASLASDRRPALSTSTPTSSVSDVVVGSTGFAAESTPTTSSLSYIASFTSFETSSGGTSIDLINSGFITSTLTSEQTQSRTSNRAVPTIADSETAASHCSSFSCSARIQAAVAVSATVGILGIIAIGTVLRRRRNRSKRTGTQIVTPTDCRKRWTRHLKIFSFDTEILLGGRTSSTNSFQSGGISHGASVRSLSSLESIVPRRVTAPSHHGGIPDQQPEMLQLSPQLLDTDDADSISASDVRPVSPESAPPPYGSDTGLPSYSSSSVSTCVNPFSDEMAVDGEEDSPFADSAEHSSITTSLRPIFSLASSTHISLHSRALTEDAETLQGTEHEG